MVKQRLKSMAQCLADTRVVRSFVANLVYPTINRCLQAEFQPDIRSASGLAEAIAWKSHAYLVFEEELRPTGKDCSEERMRCDSETRSRILQTVLERTADIEGDVLEFGVYNGESLLTFADLCSTRKVFGFDSFEGLPDGWWTRPKGAFRNTVPIPERPNLTLVRGLFDDSLPKFLEEWPNRAAIIHVDCDLYESTLSCLMPILPRCQIGCVLLFDEYYNYCDFAQHEWLAWRKVRSTYGVVARCIAYDGRRAAFQITHVERSGT